MELRLAQSARNALEALEGTLHAIDLAGVEDVGLKDEADLEERLDLCLRQHAGIP
jgi:hypothetical protein